VAQRKPYVIGVTGTIASGKSAVGNILAQQGVPVFDTDAIVHELLSLPTATRTAVIDRFGPGIADEQGAVNRRTLGKIVFADEAARRDLEAIVHPAVILNTRKKISDLENSPLVAVLAPLLFEAGLKSEYDETWSIYASTDVVKERLHSRDKLTQDEIEARLKAQWSQEKKSALADVVIDNSGSLEETARQVASRLNQLRSDR
jgi:dephospho-CoA kinase